jgi:hypothetical protein
VAHVGLSGGGDSGMSGHSRRIRCPAQGGGRDAPVDAVAGPGGGAGGAGAGLPLAVLLRGGLDRGRGRPLRPGGRALPRPVRPAVAGRGAAGVAGAVLADRGRQAGPAGRPVHVPLRARRRPLPVDRHRGAERPPAGQRPAARGRPRAPGGLLRPAAAALGRRGDRRRERAGRGPHPAPAEPVAGPDHARPADPAAAVAGGGPLPRRPAGVLRPEPFADGVPGRARRPPGATGVPRRRAGGGRLGRGGPPALRRGRHRRAGAGVAGVGVGGLPAGAGRGGPRRGAEGAGVGRGGAGGAAGG